MTFICNHFFPNLQFLGARLVLAIDHVEVETKEFTGTELDQVIKSKFKDAERRQEVVDKFEKVLYEVYLNTTTAVFAAQTAKVRVFGVEGELVESLSSHSSQLDDDDDDDDVVDDDDDDDLVESDDDDEDEEEETEASAQTGDFSLNMKMEKLTTDGEQEQERSWGSKYM